MKVSFITASYNYEKFISETIDSIIAQTYTDWELIIVDDGSKDNSIQLIQSYCEKYPNIKLFTHENKINKGLCETIKLAISKATGDYIAFLESDDYVTPDYLQKKVDVIKNNPNVKFIYNDIQMFGETEKIHEMDEYFNTIKQIFEKNSIVSKPYKSFFFLNIVPTFSCVMVEKELIANCNFDSPIPAWLDWWLWGQLSFENDFCFLNEKLSFWRMHKTSYINTAKNSITRENLKFFMALAKKLKFNDFPFYILVILRSNQRIEKMFRGVFKKLLKNVIGAYKEM